VFGSLVQSSARPEIQAYIVSAEGRGSVTTDSNPFEAHLFDLTSNVEVA